MATERTFTKKVDLYQRDSTGAFVLGPNNEKIGLNSIGEFTFRRPTVWDSMQIGVRRAQNRGDMKTLDLQTAVLADVYAVMPWQVEKAPDGWSWTDQYDPWVMLAIFEAWEEGLKELEERGKIGGVGPAAGAHKSVAAES